MAAFQNTFAGKLSVLISLRLHSKVVETGSFKQHVYSPSFRGKRSKNKPSAGSEGKFVLCHSLLAFTG